MMEERIAPQFSSLSAGICALTKVASSSIATTVHIFANFILAVGKV